MCSVVVNPGSCMNFAGIIINSNIDVVHTCGCLVPDKLSVIK